ncbi:acyl-CoA transferase/carnitine dehydratase [Amycolatopsis mediterranei S699]|uniref:Acyl-CoA transferase/carnitine dehydratase n=2 Tax=Amycolatopsis mediterranei TaxID=33910 RepID=A0A0H3D320_AMYMU|nr:CoA transferase [Amycolatopsis mediterranei]ADJ45340.1 acyl-CoA transferase/carnitine dehydratase [Amycolatopsis mediterranei U32]AEK42100.1 acyl-CoA transferase/carnitine dehydratase [Amycolatopsis mediterranei S699]AFO77051.1 acyl-CoA transferase/carnitine dehydratase [Amycolatopsis mediterranei S699]AGT84179.1 acyl-CoA transferase/carnitine dehydratase [Amycolatopsis mediterranei RB]KDO08456.1 carnitine dehydratase [Amycolatopsis mediterranei]
METTDPRALRDAMLEAVRNRATGDAFDPHAELRALLAPLGFTPEDSGGTITFHKRDPLMPSSIRIGGAAAVALAQQSVIAAKLWRMRTGLGQDITVDLGQAIRRLAPASEMKWETLNGYPADMPDRSVFAYFGFYPTRDGRHVIPPNIYPGLKSKMLAVLDCADHPEALGRAIARYTADELEALGEEHGIVFAKVRSVEEFVAEPVFEHLASRPLIEIEKVADTPPEPLPEWGTHPLSGIRALGMGHVIAGAGIGRSLASLGADVLNVWRVAEFEQDPLIATANVGMRSTRLNVRGPDGRETLRALLRDADIFFANRRPGLLTELGVDAEQAFAVRPGLIHVTASCHGETGPWARRVGFDQVAGTVTGMVAAEGTLEAPKLPPTSIINDYLVAWLGATGAMAALARRATEGGSYRIHVSLTRAAMWAVTLGFFDWDHVHRTVGSGGEHELLDPQLFTSLTPLGIYQGVTENITLSRTPHHYLNVLSPRGADQPVWLPRPQMPDVAALAKILGRG